MVFLVKLVRIRSDKTGIQGIIDVDIFDFFIKRLQAVLLYRNQRNIYEEYVRKLVKVKKN